MTADSTSSVSYYEPTPRVVCLGILVADVIGRPIDKIPEQGALQLVPSITPHIGGCAANTGIGLQTLGVPTTVVGKVGRDSFGAFLRDELHSHSVTARVVEDDYAPTSATMVLVSSNAERTFLHCTGANATFGSGDFPLEWLDDVELLHIAGHGLMSSFDGAPCAALLASARKLGLKTSLDTAGAPNPQWYHNLKLCLPHLDYFVPSLHEVRGLFPDIEAPELIAQKFLDLGVDVVALKMGERGSFVCDANESYLCPAFSVAAVDATGAGDAFAAGFLCGILRGWSLHECARLGNATGALCVTQTGTVAGYQKLEPTLDWISRNSP